MKTVRVEFNEAVITAMANRVKAATLSSLEYSGVLKKGPAGDAEAKQHVSRAIRKAMNGFIDDVGKAESESQEDATLASKAPVVP